MQSYQSTISTTTDPDDPLISSSGRVYVSGSFPYLSVLDSTSFAEIDRIPIEADSHCRLSLFENPNDETGCWIAVSQGNLVDPSDSVLVYDAETKECVNRLIGAKFNGELETISNSSLSSYSIVVTTGREKILVFDAVTSDVLCEFSNPPFYTYRISHFPKWNRNRVFVGGGSPFLLQFDLHLEECVQLGKYRGHNHNVRGLSASLSHQLLFSGSFDKTVKCWNFNQFDSCVNSIQLDYPCFSVKYLEDLNLICCGNYSEIEIFDIRNLSQRMRKVRNIGNREVQDLDRIESDSSSPTSSDPLCVSCVSGCGDYFSVWNPVSGAVRQIRDYRDFVCGVEFRGKPDLSPFTRVDEDERIQYVMQMATLAVIGDEENVFILQRCVLTDIRCIDKGTGSPTMWIFVSIL